MIDSATKHMKKYKSTTEVHKKVFLNFITPKAHWHH